MSENRVVSFVTVSRLLALIAVVLFVLAAFGVSFGVVHVGWLGLAFLAGSLLA